MSEGMVAAPTEARWSDLSGDEQVAWILAAGVCGVLLCSIPNAEVGYERYAVTKELVATTATLAALVSAARRGIALSFGIPTLAAIGVCGAGVVVASASEFGLQWNGVRETGILMVLLVSFVLARSLDSPSRRLLLVIIATGLATSSAIVLAEGLGIIPSMSLPRRGPGGLLGNRNFAAELAVFGLVAAVASSRSARSRRSVLNAHAGVVLCVAAIVVSRGRTALIGGAIACASVLLLLYRERDRSAMRLVTSVLLGAVGGVAISFVAWPPSAMGSTVASLVDIEQGSGRGRLIQARSTPRLVERRHGLGVGVGNWAAAYSLARLPGDPTFDARSIEPIGRIPSSDWVATVAEQGPLGALVIVVWLGSTIVSGRGPRDEDRNLVPRATLVVCTAVMGIGDAVIIQAQGALIVGTLLGALAARPPGALIVVPWTPQARRLRRPAGLVLVGAPLLCGAWIAARAALAIAFFSPTLDAESLARVAAEAPGLYFVQVYAAARLSTARRCEESGQHARRADLLLPGRPIAARMEALCHAAPRASSARVSSASPVPP